MKKIKSFLMKVISMMDANVTQAMLNSRCL